MKPYLHKKSLAVYKKKGAAVLKMTSVKKLCNPRGMGQPRNGCDGRLTSQETL